MKTEKILDKKKNSTSFIKVLQVNQMSFFVKENSDHKP